LANINIATKGLKFSSELTKYIMLILMNASIPAFKVLSKLTAVSIKIKSQQAVYWKEIM
jgi:hypothetical protein